MLDREQILREVYAAFNRRDIDAVFTRMSPGVDWPNGMEGGREIGFAAVRAYWTRQWTMVDPHVEPTAFTSDQDGRTVVRVHQVVRDLTGNILLDRPVNHIYTFAGVLVTRMDIMEPEGTPAG